MAKKPKSNPLIKALWIIGIALIIVLVLVGKDNSLNQLFKTQANGGSNSCLVTTIAQCTKTITVLGSANDNLSPTVDSEELGKTGINYKLKCGGIRCACQINGTATGSQCKEGTTSASNVIYGCTSQTFFTEPQTFPATAYVPYSPQNNFEQRKQDAFKLACRNLYACSPTSSQSGGSPIGAGFCYGASLKLPTPSTMILCTKNSCATPTPLPTPATPTKPAITCTLPNGKPCIATPPPIPAGYGTNCAAAGSTCATGLTCQASNGSNFCLPPRPGF